MTILGISAFYHDSAAAIIQDGKILSAVQEERFTRVKHDASFPIQACKFCLSENNLQIDDLDAVVFYDKPFLKFERLLETYYQFAPKGIRSFINSMPVWLNQKLFTKRLIRKKLEQIHPYNNNKLKLLFSEHHLSHAASAFFASPYAEAAILTIDGVGEWATTSIAIGKGNSITVIKELHFPHSVGLLYAAFTYFLGFKINGGEYKLMGLAPYGNSESEQTKRFIQQIYKHLIDLKPDGSVWLNQRYFSYSDGLKMANDKRWQKLFSFTRRKSNEPIEQQHCNLAYAIQHITETIIIKMAREAKKLTGLDQLCIAGGVGLNCVANGKLLASKIFEDIFIQPAAGDAGGALGAALATYFIHYNKERIILSKRDLMQGASFGPGFDSQAVSNIAGKLKTAGIHYPDFQQLCKIVAEKLADGKVVGWFQDNMEFGPRALGYRSILADPRKQEMQRVLNLKIKNRESFRPFAPIVLASDCSDYFELDEESPYMLMVAKVKKERRKEVAQGFEKKSIKEKLSTPLSDIPAVTHVDFSSRIQTVSEASNFKLNQLLNAFKKQTGCSVLVNTSFNVKDEPIVCTPEDAFRCFQKTEMDFLVIQNYLFEKD